MLIKETVITAQGLLTFALLLLVFIFDLAAPLGVAAATPYGIVLLSTLWIKNNKITYVIAILSILLTVAGYYLSPDPVSSINTVLINRFLAIVIIISSTFLVIQRKNASYKIKKLAFLSSTDHLTQVRNRFAFDRKLHSETTRSKRYKRHLSLAILDIDNFKNVNDTYGHDQGDFTIKKVCNQIIASIRQSDILYRVGGDEFAIIFIETNIKDAEIIGNKICKRIMRTVTVGEDKVTLSIGISSFNFDDDNDNDDEESLFKRADDALYSSKNNGRNRVSTNPEITV